MKHKKLLMTGMAILFASSMSFAQLTVGLSTGYHMPAFKSNVGMNTNVTSSGDATMSNNYYSMGGGLPIEVFLGIPIGSNVSFDFGICYWLGSSVTTDMTDNKATSSTEETVAKSNQIRINPGFTFMSESGLYGRAGLVIPIGGKTTFTMTTKGGGDTEEFKGESTGNFSLGAFSAVGYAMEVASGIHLFFELQALALNIVGATQTVTDYSNTANPDVTAADLPTFIRETNYMDELDGNSNTDPFDPNFDPDKPLDALASVASFGAVGLNVGVAITLGK